MAKFLDEAGKGALTAAIREVEGKSAAEVVIAVRQKSGKYLHVDILAGCVAALAMLAFLLFSPWPFALHWFLVDPLLAGVAVAVLVAGLAPLRRAFSSKTARREAVRTAARAAFVDKGVHHTRGRTGLLVYVSRFERAAEIVADVGVLQRVDDNAWRAGIDAIDAAVRDGADAATLARRIAALAGPLGKALPHRADDVNELPDEVGAG